jgi:23S rRNA pseudouridine1911/1915/1917 synthase
MQEQRISKEYLAIVWAGRRGTEKQLTALYARQGLHSPSPIWLKQVIHAEGAPASTGFAVEKRFEKNFGGRTFSLVRALPRTGRTHRFACISASLGHPIVGDKIYGPDEQNYLALPSKPVGRANCKTRCCYHDMPCTPRA